jgi:hypothetical protein
MKKTGAVFCVAAALAALINASVWEGAASGSTGGDLPETGYYVATNSFPRNTVVDITNLENGKTIRAVVSASLDNPGLLAVLSGDAANAISLPARSIGRVRMNQPADPVAFSRFTEGLSSSEDPDHNPTAFVAANGINPELLGDRETASPAEEVPAASGADMAPPETGTGVVTGIAEAADAGAVEFIPPDDPRVAESSETTGVPEEETAAVPDKTGLENSDDLTILDLPEPYVPPASPGPDEDIIPETNPELVWIPREETKGEELIEPEPEDRAEVTDGMIITDTGEPDGLLTEAGDALAEDTPEPVEKAENFPGDYDLTLLPAEERPPESTEPVIPADQIFPSGAETGPALPPPPPGGEGAPSLPHGLAESAGDYGFPVPVITELEEGKYYLQLAASRNQDAVKTELAKIGTFWPLAVQVNEGEHYPYRILIGPVNQGESRALLLRFKNSGYQNAFVTDKALQTKSR